MSVFSIDYNPILNIIITGCRDNKIRFFQYNDDECDLDLFDDEIEHESDVNCVRFSKKDPNIFASCSDDEYVKVWKIENLLE